MKTAYLLLFLFTFLPVANSERSLSYQRKMEQQAKIRQLYRDYPPEETKWVYEIQQGLRQ